jgi:hypothetical protein
MLYWEGKNPNKDSKTKRREPMINPNHVNDLRGCEKKVNLTSIVDERQRETNYPYRACH